MSLSKIRLTDPGSIRVDTSGRAIGFFCVGLPARVDRELIKELKEMAANYQGKNIRLCLHSGPEATFHTMIILEHKGRYYRPHKHLEKGECFHILEGRMAVFAFDDQGEIIDACCLDPERIFMYKVQVDMYHAVMPLTQTVIYHESKLGPFLGDTDSIFPAWAPDGTNEEDVSEYNRRLLKLLEF